MAEIVEEALDSLLERYSMASEFIVFEIVLKSLGWK